MKLLLDQGLPLRTASLLREAGWDAVHTGEIAMSSSDDELILHQAAKENRTVVTLDADFHQILARQAASKPSVVRIRVEGLSYLALTELLLRELPLRAIAMNTGAAISISERGVRIRMLPLITTPGSPPQQHS